MNWQCRGFSPALTKLKEDINLQHPELPQENPGSRWPKTSLGALKDGQRLTPDDLRILTDLCRQVKLCTTGSRGSLYEAKACCIKAKTAALLCFRSYYTTVEHKAGEIPVAGLEVVLYKCRWSSCFQLSLCHSCLSVLRVDVVHYLGTLLVGRVLSFALCIVHSCCIAIHG